MTLSHKALPGPRPFFDHRQVSSVQGGWAEVAVTNVVQVLAADPRRWPFIKGSPSGTWGCLRMTVVLE